MAVLEQEPRRRGRDAKQARQAILDAAEVNFAERGFAGARIEAIAKMAGYNVSLLFQYFGDKSGLYAAVLHRAHQDTVVIQTQLLGQGPTEETMAFSARAFRAVLTSLVQATFDYLQEHPRLRRLLTWEMAEGWQTYLSIASQFPPDASDRRLEDLFTRARKAGWLRSDDSALSQVLVIFQICLSHLACLPLSQLLVPDKEGSTEQALARVRQRLVPFLVAGIMIDLPSTLEETDENTRR